MNSFEQLLRYITLIGFAFALLLAFGQALIVKKNLRTYAFMALYFCIAALEFSNFNTDLDMHYLWPHFSYVDIPLLYSIGPLLLIIFCETLEKEGKLGKYGYHFILPCITLALTLPYYSLDASEKIDRAYNVFIKDEVYLLDYLYTAGLFITISYVAVILARISFIWRNGIVHFEAGAKLITTILLMSAVTVALAITCMVTREYLFFRISAATIALSMATIHLMNYRYADMTSSLVSIVEETKYKTSHLNSVDLKQLQKELDKLMQQDKIYRDEELSLGKLAKKLDISMHQLSQYLNSHLQINFAHFINRYRIEEAKQLLLDEPDSTILRIAYQVGFNSNSSFHRFFVKEVGASPRVFREQVAGASLASAKE